MPNKPLDRLMFAQGGLCFFCRKPLPKSEASVEHLVATVNGGSNNDENCVACCKSFNALLGKMSLKEKIQVVLNQKGQFKCPNDECSVENTLQAKDLPSPQVMKKPQEDKLALVIENLKQRGHSKPKTLKTLSSTIVSLFPKGLSNTELADLIERLKVAGKILITGNKVTYPKL